MKSNDKSMNASSEAVETPKSQPAPVERRQHPRGTLIESLTDVTYRVLREYQQAA